MRIASWTRSTGLMSLLVVGVLTACEEDVYSPPAPTGYAAQVDAMRLVLGTGQTVTLYTDGRITLAPLWFPRPNTTLKVEMLDRNGNVLPPDANAVRVNVGSSNPRNSTGSSGVVSFERVDSFSGSLIAANNAGSTTLQIGLFDLLERKIVIGPYPVPILTR